MKRFLQSPCVFTFLWPPSSPFWTGKDKHPVYNSVNFFKRLALVLASNISDFFYESLLLKLILMLT